MTFDQLRYFLETAKFEHLGKASISLHISPSAVSSAIAALESEFACKLFNRQGKGIILSEKGRYLRAQLEKIFDELTKIQLALGEKEVRLSGSYRIGASPFLAVHYLGKVWAKTQGAYPQLSTEIGATATANVLSGVLSGVYDGGFCFSPLKHPHLKCFEIYKGQMQIAARKGHPIFKSVAKQQFDLLNNYPASIHKATPGVDICEDHPMFEKFGLKPNIQSLWDSDDVGVEIVSNSEAWALLPELVVQCHRTKIQAIAMPKAWDAPYFIGFIIRPHRIENPFLKLLMGELKKAFENSASPTGG